MLMRIFFGVLFSTSFFLLVFAQNSLGAKFTLTAELATFLLLLGGFLGTLSFLFPVALKSRMPTKKVAALALFSGALQFLSSYLMLWAVVDQKVSPLFVAFSFLCLPLFSEMLRKVVWREYLSLNVQLTLVLALGLVVFWVLFDASGLEFLPLQTTSNAVEKMWSQFVAFVAILLFALSLSIARPSQIQVESSVFLVFSSLSAMLLGTIFFAANFAFFAQPKSLLASNLRLNANEFLWAAAPLVLFGFVHFSLRQLVRRFRHDFSGWQRAGGKFYKHSDGELRGSLLELRNFFGVLLSSFVLIVCTFVAAKQLQINLSVWHAMSFIVAMLLVLYVQVKPLPKELRQRNAEQQLGVVSIL